MNQSALATKITEVENQVRALQKAYTQEYNSEAVYSTKDTYGYAQIMEVRGGTTLYLSGMTPWDKELKVQGNTLIEQLDHTLNNLKLLLESKGLSLDHLVSLRCYLAQADYYEDMPGLGEVLTKHLGKDIKCTLTVVGVTGLAEPEQLVEVEAVAVH